MDKRIRRIYTALALFLLTGCAHQDEWTSGDTVLEGIYLATVVADGYMTSKIDEHPNIVENGRIAKHLLGPEPKTSDIVWYMATMAISHYLIARALPRGWRGGWQVFGIANHGLAVNSGHQMGLFSQPCTTPVPEAFRCEP